MFAAALLLVAHIFADPLVVCGTGACSSLDQHIGTVGQPAAAAPVAPTPVGPIESSEPTGLIPFSKGVFHGLVTDTLMGLWAAGKLTGQATSVATQGALFAVAHPIQAAQNVKAATQATGDLVKAGVTEFGKDPVGNLVKAKDSVVSAGSAALESVQKSCSGFTESCGDIVGNVAGLAIPVGDVAKVAGLVGKTGEALNIAGKLEKAGEGLNLASKVPSVLKPAEGVNLAAKAASLLKPADVISTADNLIADATKAGKPLASAAGAVVDTGTVLWSGGPEAKEAAQAWAGLNKGTTLEMTPAGQALEKSTKGMPFEQADPLWRAASKDLVDGASGNVHVFLNADGVRPGNVLMDTELKALAARAGQGKLTSVTYHIVQNGKVTDIITHAVPLL